MHWFLNGDAYSNLGLIFHGYKNKNLSENNCMKTEGQ